MTTTTDPRIDIDAAGSMAATVVHALLDADAARPRSTQAAVGPSEIGGCRAKAWHRINATAVSNPDARRLAAIMGTAIHAAIEAALTRTDPWRYELERAVEVDGLPGHIDCYDTATATVWDWKTITKKNVDWFPSLAQRWQAHLYGWLLSQTGRPVARVGLVGIVRDGHEDDVIEVVEDYDPGIAGDALAWLAQVRAAETCPPPEKDAATFCARFCEFHGACPGLAKHTPAGGPPLGEDTSAAVHAWLAAKADADDAKRRLEAARAALEGVSGTTADGWRVSWSTRAAATVDRDAIKSALGAVPMKPGRESAVLSVKQVGA